MAQNNALSARLDALSTELEQALEFSRSLQSQHAEATSTVKVLEERVQSLEKDMARRVTEVSGAGKAAEDRWEAWKNRFEEGWRKEKEGWELERERLRGVVREWEEASRRAQEEEEERSMNKRISGDDTVDSDDADEEEASDRSRGKRSGSRSWPETSAAGDSDDDEGVDIPRSARRNSHSASPSSLRHDTSRRSRRESSSRLDPAIRALRATAGDLPEQQAKSGPGSRTPRMGSPSAADGALEALRVKSSRPKRADTIKGRKRNQTIKADTPEVSAEKKASDTPTLPSDKPAHLQIASKDDEKGSDGNNTSTESDETAHGRSQDDITVDDDTATITPAPAEGQGALLIGHVSSVFCDSGMQLILSLAHTSGRFGRCHRNRWMGVRQPNQGISNTSWRRSKLCKALAKGDYQIAMQEEAVDPSAEEKLCDKHIAMHHCNIIRFRHVALPFSAFWLCERTLLFSLLLITMLVQGVSFMPLTLPY